MTIDRANSRSESNRIQTELDNTDDVRLPDREKTLDFMDYLQIPINNRQAFSMGALAYFY